MKLSARLLFVCLVASIWSGTAFAQLFRTYLSFNGNDANPCTAPLPCRLLPAALAAVQNGGEIWMVDSANYNTAPVNITKSVKILAIPGAMGSVVGNGGDAIVINVPGGNVTLRNLVVLNFNGGVNGVTILDAGAVHIEKLSIDGFNSDASSCIQLIASTNVRLYVNDSILKNCRNGIYANGTVVSSNRSSVVVDNTRIERGFNTGGAGIAVAVWMQGFMDVSLRNSVISRQDFGIQFDGLLAGSTSHLEIINSELTRNTTALQFANAAAGASGQISIVGSQIASATDAVLVSNTAVGGNTWVKLVDTTIVYTGNGGVQLSNSAADVNTRMGLEMVRSHISNIATTAVDLVATNGSQVQFDARDSTISNAVTGIRTSGTASTINASVIRTNLHHTTTAIDHGQGNVQLDGTHVNYNVNDFVNSGSVDIVSIGNNFIYNNTTTGITPTIIAPK